MSSWMWERFPICRLVNCNLSSSSNGGDKCVGADKIIRAWSIETQCLETALKERDERLSNYRNKKSIADAGQDTAADPHQDYGCEDDFEAAEAQMPPFSASEVRAVKVSKKSKKKSGSKHKKKTSKSPYSLTVIESADLVKQWSIEHHNNINAVSVMRKGVHLEMLAKPVFVADMSSDVSLYRL
jgi:hypothetical protein